MRIPFYGYEVQAFGYTIAWTLNKQEAEKAFKESHGMSVMYKHNGDIKVAISTK